MIYRVTGSTRMRRGPLPWLILLLLGVACSQGEKRDYLGPPDPHPVDNTLAAVVVTPHLGTLQPGEPITLAAFGRTAKGDSVSAQVSWSASGGTVDGYGHFEAESPGSFWIVARSVVQADRADSANVVVVGPDNPITHVVVSPKTLAIRIGQSRQFTASAYLQDGSQASVPIFWSASGGSITSSGVYTTPASPGEYLVIAVVGNGLTDTATVTVANNPVLTSITLDPAADSVDQGATRQFVVNASWSDGSSAAPKVDFSTTGGVIDSTGAYSADAEPGDYLVLAKERGGTKTATSRIWVVSQALASIDLTPSSIALSPGASQKFTAIGLRPSGETVKVLVNWQATGGTITSNGQYVAGSTPGTYRVIATQSGGELADTALVVISSPVATLTQLVLNPSSATVPAGDTYHFSVSGSWSDGSSSTPAIDWSATGGTVSAQGDYTAGSAPGTFRVIAHHHGGTLSDTSVVTVGPPILRSLTLTPGTVSIDLGTTAQFTVAALWTDGSGTLPQLAWTVQGGTMSPSGLFTAGANPGTYRIIVRDAGATVADTAFVTIKTPEPVLQAVVVEPASVTLQAGAPQQFFASGVWTNGGTADPAVTWSATGGSVTAGGLYTAGSTAGTFAVIAREPVTGKADTAQVTILPPTPQLIGITLSPNGRTVQPGSTQQYSVQGIWTNGGSGSPPVYYSATGGSISSSGLYTAGSTPGTFRVIAVVQGGSLADSVSVTVASAAPTLVGLDVTPATASVGVNASQQFSVAGVWTNGGTGTPAVTWTASGGNVTQTGLYTAGSSAGTFKVIASQQGGPLADTAVVTVSNSAPTLTGVQILPGDVTIQTGTRIEFQIAATWSDGSTARPAIDWSTTGGGSIGTDGGYVAGNAAGTWKVMAKVHGGTLADTVSVTVGSPYVTKVNLTPATVTLSGGSTQQFSASASWSDGVSRPVAVSYQATGGTISVSGLYTAGQMAGTFAVIAACGCGKADTSLVTITAPSTPPTATLVSLAISPSAVSLPPGGSQQFSVSAQWSDGSTALPPVTWAATGGSISASGVYSAPSQVGQYVVLVSSGTKADTAIVDVASGTPGPNPSYPNEPAGLTPLAELAYAASLPAPGAFATPGTFGVLNGKFNQFGTGIGTTGTVADATAPRSSPYAFFFKFPAGMPPSTSNAVQNIWSSSNSEYTTLYESSWFRVGSPVTHDFENQLVATKVLGYWYAGGSQTGVLIGILPNHSGATALESSWNLRFDWSFSGQPGQMIRVLTQNMNTNKKVMAGQWHRIEILLQSNTMGSGNGVLKVWLDGVQTHDYQDVTWRTPTYSRGFFSRHWDPVWGGQGGPNKSRDDYILVDHFYMSGK